MKDIILARLAALLEEKIDPKLRAERLKRKSKAYDNRVHKNYTAQPRDEDPPPSDDELKDMAKDYGYGKKEEAIDFPKTTTRGKAARATAADTLKDVKSRMQTSGLAKKPGDAAKLTKQFSKENYKQRESTNLKDRMVDALAQKLTESPMEFNYRRETPEEKAANKKRVEQLRREARAKKKPSGESEPEADGGEGTKPGSYFTNRHGGRTEN